jgi:hypothetical protein
MRKDAIRQMWEISCDRFMADLTISGRKCERVWPMIDDDFISFGSCCHYVQKTSLPAVLFSNPTLCFVLIHFGMEFSKSLMTIWYNLWPFALSYGTLVYFRFICYIIHIFGFLYCVKKNLATLFQNQAPHKKK